MSDGSVRRRSGLTGKCVLFRKLVVETAENANEYAVLVERAVRRKPVSQMERD
jgi:hypothetical protein